MIQKIKKSVKTTFFPVMPHKQLMCAAFVMEDSSSILSMRLCHMAKH